MTVGTAPARGGFPWRDILVTVAAIVLALIIGAVLMVVSDPEVMAKFSYFFAQPSDFILAAVQKVCGAYGALLRGSIGGLGPLSHTAAESAPLILAGLGVALAFRTGLINIGAQGQAIWGAIAAAYVGFSLHLPPVLHLLLALVAGLVAGAIWGGIVGWLKARTGAHEVIVTIMMNYIAAGILAYLLTTEVFRRPGRTDPISPVVDWNATYPRMAGTQFHLGFVIALVAAVGVWWLLEKSTLGFALKAVGSNPHAAGTAGMSVSRATVTAMLIAGALAGLAGVDAALGPDVGGTPVSLSAGIVGAVGFDAVTVALLGRSRPLGVVLAGLLFGALHAGGLAMQSTAQTPLTLTTVLQALIVLFVAAPALITKVLPFLRGARGGTGVPQTTGAL